MRGEQKKEHGKSPLSYSILNAERSRIVTWRSVPEAFNLAWQDNSSLGFMHFLE